MLTVLIATHNGTDTLGRTLEQLCAVVPPRGGWKLLIVNNASTDGTEELVRAFRDRLPLDYLVEPRLGKAYALNTGLEHISGDLVVFADDDVLPDPDWLVAWRTAVDRHPDYSIFGGTIEPLYERDPPRWLSRTPWWGSVLFARTEPQPEGTIKGIGLNIYGPNMAVRFAALADGTRFDERFFVGSRGLMGEETELVKRLIARGDKACFVPGARVRHIVHPGQLAWWRMLKRFYRVGKSMAVVEVREHGRHGRELFHAPRWRFRRLIMSALKIPIALLSCDRHRIFWHLHEFAYQFGIIVQYRVFALDPQWQDLI